MEKKNKRPGAPQSYQQTTVVHKNKKKQLHRKRKYKGNGDGHNGCPRPFVVYTYYDGNLMAAKSKNPSK